MRNGRGEHIEDGEEPRLRVPMTLDLGLQARSPRRVTRLQVGADESVFAAEGVVEAGLRDAGAFDDRVDADGVDASLVEQLPGCGKESVSR